MRTLRAVMVGLFVCSCIGFVGLVAQHAAAQEAAADPAKDELAQTLLQLARKTAQLAQAACQQTPEVREWNATRDEIGKKLATRYPGYTVDWQKFALVPTPKK